MRSKENVRWAPAVLLILALLAVPLAAQEMPGKNAPGLKRAARDFFEDTGRIWSSPFHIKERHAAPLILMTAATGFLIAADESIRDAFKSYTDGHKWAQDVGPVITQMGSLGAAATAGLFLGAGFIFKDERARDTGYLAACAMAQTFLVVNVFKGLSGRQRPFATDGEDHWAGPAGFFKSYDADYNGLYDSFPSGHTATAFSVATVVALQYRHRPWVPILAYTIAAGVGLSRGTMDLHWMSDVFVGAVVGHLVARLVVRGHARRQRLVPVLGSSGRGITVGFYYNLDPIYY
ncbi:MAG: phosphatase PAP2 family protein [Candidatus Aminicenantes bacterium]|nr:phosphatase PAP2 family protein [Candidatus Aminicenantes bacterium]